MHGADRMVTACSVLEQFFISANIVTFESGIAMRVTTRTYPSSQFAIPRLEAMYNTYPSVLCGKLITETHAKGADGKCNSPVSRT